MMSFWDNWQMTIRTYMVVVYSRAQIWAEEKYEQASDNQQATVVPISRLDRSCMGRIARIEYSLPAF